MDRKKIKAAVEEAERFLKRVKALPKPETRVKSWQSDGSTFLDESIPPKDGGAIRRASMDLTRALADLRRPGA